MLAGCLLLTLFVPGIAMMFVRHTRARWLPGIALIGVAIYLFAMQDHGDHGDDGAGALTGIGNVILGSYALAMLLYAAILLRVAWRARKPPIPPA